MSDSKVKSIKTDYMDELQKRPRSDDGAGMDILQVKKHGQKVILGDHVDRKIQVYLRRVTVRDGGGCEFKGGHRCSMKGT